MRDRVADDADSRVEPLIERRPSVLTASSVVRAAAPGGRRPGARRRGGVPL